MLQTPLPVQALTCWQPETVWQLSAVQLIPSSQEIAVPEQAPPEHVSPLVQTLPSSQGAVFGGCRQPDSGRQTSSVQGLPSMQLGGGPPTQTPLEQESPVEQALPSSHEPGTAEPPWQSPSLQDSFTVHGLASSQLPLFGVCSHPVCELQVSSVQGLASSQLVGPPAKQIPFWHWSPVVHSLPSSQGPSASRW